MDTFHDEFFGKGLSVKMATYGNYIKNPFHSSLESFSLFLCCNSNYTKDEQ